MNIHTVVWKTSTQSPANLLSVCITHTRQIEPQTMQKAADEIASNLARVCHRHHLPVGVVDKRVHEIYNSSDLRVVAIAEDVHSWSL